jgi:excisionase family DNA binding protein
MLRSVKEVAGMLGIGRDSVVRLIRRGHLKAVEFPPMGGRGKNKKRMVDDDEVGRFKERNGGRG